MGAHSFVVDINAPPSAVYDLWTNPDRVAEWIEGVTRVEATERPVSAGTSYVLWFGRMKTHVEVLTADPPSIFRSRNRSRILSTETETTFEPLPAGGTRLTESFRTHGLVSGLFGRIFSLGSYKGSFRGELSTFKRLCEANR